MQISSSLAVVFVAVASSSVAFGDDDYHTVQLLQTKVEHPTVKMVKKEHAEKSGFPGIWEHPPGFSTGDCNSYAIFGRGKDLWEEKSGETLCEATDSEVMCNMHHEEICSQCVAICNDMYCRDGAGVVNLPDLEGNCYFLNNLDRDSVFSNCVDGCFLWLVDVERFSPTGSSTDLIQQEKGHKSNHLQHKK